MMDIAAEIALHFKCAGPALESEHCLPIEPEVRLPEAVGEHLRNLLVLEVFFGSYKQLWKRKSRVLVKIEFLVGVCVLTAVYRSSAQRIVRVVFVEPIVFVEYGNAGSFKWRYITEHIPHYFEMVIHFTSASHKEAFCNVFSSVAAAACQFEFFQKMNVLALHLSVSDKIEGCGKSRKSCADNVCRFFIDILRFLGMSKWFVSACWIIHTKTSCCFVMSLVYSFFSCLQ